MNEGTVPVAFQPADGGFRYRAFISYAHRDEAAARALHRALEAYKIPSRLVGSETCLGPAPRRLGRFFRDRDELSAAGDLSEVLKAALADSQFLIVVVSRAAAASKWVKEEIRLFKQMGRAAHVLAYIPPDADGSTDEIFPETLRYAVLGDGSLSAERAEPIAADARKSGDGVRLARLKLVAGLTCLGLDDLVQREAQRRQRFLGVFAVAASVLALVFAWLAAQAVEGRREAERQRAEADGLIGFMLTDLRARLDAVGRLEVLDSVGQRALAYYAKQDLARLSADELARRASALVLVGEVRNRRGDLEGALAAYQEAKRTTAEQLARTPGDPERMFDHAQAVFWVGEVAWQRKDKATTEAMFREYDRLARAMVATDPANPKWLQEQSYAHAALGAWLKGEGRYAEAAAQFEQGLVIDRRLAENVPPDSPAHFALGQSHAWLADALLDAGDFSGAATHRLAEIEAYDRLLAADPRHAMAREGKANALSALARARMLAGANLAEAQPLFAQSRALFAEQIEADPANLLVREVATGALGNEVEVLMAAGRWREAQALNTRLLAEARALLAADPSNIRRRDVLVIPAEAHDIAILMGLGEREAARRAIAAFRAAHGDMEGAPHAMAMVAALEAADLARQGNAAGAAAARAQAIQLLSRAPGSKSRALLAYLQGQREAAGPMDRIMAGAG